MPYKGNGAMGDLWVCPKEGELHWLLWQQGLQQSMSLKGLASATGTILGPKETTAWLLATSTATAVP